MEEQKNPFYDIPEKMKPMVTHFLRMFDFLSESDKMKIILLFTQCYLAGIDEDPLLKQTENGDKL